MLMLPRCQRPSAPVSRRSPPRARRTMLDVRCGMPDPRDPTRCSMFDARCPTFDARRSMLDARCSLYDARNSTSDPRPPSFDPRNPTPDERCPTPACHGEAVVRQSLPPHTRFPPFSLIICGSAFIKYATTPPVIPAKQSVSKVDTALCASSVNSRLGLALGS